MDTSDFGHTTWDEIRLEDDDPDRGILCYNGFCPRCHGEGCPEYAEGFERARQEVIGAKGGRPEIGPAFSLRFQPELLAAVDAAADSMGISRAEWIRRAALGALGA